MSCKKFPVSRVTHFFFEVGAEFVYKKDRTVVLPTEVLLFSAEGNNKRLMRIPLNR